MINRPAPMRCTQPGCPYIGLWQLTNNHCPRHRRDHVDAITALDPAPPNPPNEGEQP